MKEVEKFMTEHHGAKPDHYDFNGLMASVYCGTFQSATVCNSIANTGLFSCNRDSVSEVAIAPSLVTEIKDPNNIGLE
jgi:hypothetical protein